MCGDKHNDAPTRPENRSPVCGDKYNDTPTSVWRQIRRHNYKTQTQVDSVWRQMRHKRNMHSSIYNNLSNYITIDNCSVLYIKSTAPFLLFWCHTASSSQINCIESNHKYTLLYNQCMFTRLWFAH